LDGFGLSPVRFGTVVEVGVAAVGLEDGAGVVGGTAVYNPIVKVGVILRQDAFDGGPDIVPLVEGRGNDGDKGWSGQRLSFW
jgi:hypothetical protein